jgi:hypothetical protein
MRYIYSSCVEARCSGTLDRPFLFAQIYTVTSWWKVVKNETMAVDQSWISQQHHLIRLLCFIYNLFYFIYRQLMPRGHELRKVWSPFFIGANIHIFFEIFVITMILADATDVCSLQLTDFTNFLIEPEGPQGQQVGFRQLLQFWQSGYSTPFSSYRHLQDRSLR